jgi:hypothetical protein
MKSIAEMEVGELAAFLCDHLRKKGFDPVLTGGSVVTIYSANKYVSLDLDFVERRGIKTGKLKEAMAEVGFRSEDRHFIHPETELFVEFPPGPLSVGDEPIRDIRTLSFDTGELRIISPTESVKDRLAAWYHWKDRQSLDQAVLVAEAHDIDIDEIERWSRHEGKKAEFESIRTRLVRRT